MEEYFTEQCFSLYMKIVQGKPDYTVTYHGFNYPKDKLEYKGNACDDVMTYLDYDFRTIQASRKRLREIYNQIKNSNATEKLFNDFCSEARAIAEIIKDDLPVLSQVLLVFIENVYQTNDDIILSMDEIWYQIDTLTYVKSNLTETLTWLADKQLNSENRRELPVLDSLTDFNAKVNIEYANGEIHYTYLVDNVERFLNILIYTYISTKPRIAVCHYCNKFFVPKTNRRTLYCDRITATGNDCKTEGARATYKNTIQNDEVLKRYNEEKHRIQMYCRRSLLDLNDPLDDMYNWLDFFEPKMNAYKAGQFSGEELLSLLEEKKKENQPGLRLGKYFSI